MLSTFDPDKGPLFQGEFGNLAVIDPALPGHVGNLVLDPTKPYTVRMTWELWGTDVPLYLAALDPQWQVAAFAESMGPGPEIRLGSDAVLVSSGVADATKPFGMVWTHDLTVPAGTLPEDVGGTSGVYKIVATVFLNSSIGAPGFDIAGFAEGPLVRIENPV
ncbi:MAG TPA: hypothetical protein PLV41_05555 [Miltoncostaeales bacterium]|jgi:hypothetical protein|nr:hypothetical protein [Miltoncostaeales bacterium]